MTYTYQGSKEPIRNNVSSGIKSPIVDFDAEDQGRLQISLAKTRDFLDFDMKNSKSKSWRITIQFEYFPPSN